MNPATVRLPPRFPLDFLNRNHSRSTVFGLDRDFTESGTRRRSWSGGVSACQNGSPRPPCPGARTRPAAGKARTASLCRVLTEGWHRPCFRVANGSKPDYRQGAEPMTTLPPISTLPLAPHGADHNSPAPRLSPLHLDWGRERLRVELQAIKTLGLCSRAGLLV